MAYTPVTLSDEQKAALEQEHEDILILRGGERAPWIVVVKRPSRKDTLAYKLFAKRDNTTANEEFIKRIRVFPDESAFEKQLDRWPLLCDGIADSDAFKSFLGLAVGEDLKT